jgi:hypothetical protein
MRKLLMKGAAILALSVVALLTFSVQATAAPNNHIGPFAGGSNDGGSCGNEWAVDTYTLTFAVKNNGNGTFDVKVDYKNGAFTTISGPSPGACSTANNHGTTVAGGIKGDFQGTLSETVTSATYNPNGCAIAANCSTRSGAIASLFPGATGEDNFKYNFEYHSNDKTLSNRHWQDRSGPNGDIFVGDISN